jgi:hypothetical protein
MQKKIDQLESKLRGVQDSGSRINPEAIDLDNEQWMQFFIDQLKLRTIRGTS